MMRSAAAAHHPMQHTGPMHHAVRCEPPTQQQQLTEAIVAPGAMERTAKMAEAKMIFMIDIA
jgi:hypothetical protein